MAEWQVWSAAAAGSGTASGAGPLAGAGRARKPAASGQLAQGLGERRSAQQLLRSKAETGVLKGQAAAREAPIPRDLAGE